jgi:A/G-specific adenine glycosylase
VAVVAQTTLTSKPWQTRAIPNTNPLLDQKTFSTKLIGWYSQERAHLPVPGRNSDDPYAIWVAEIMLQQTQIATVRPFYKRWMSRFPTIVSLSLASQDQVLKRWEGLGYYSRARNLHAAAKAVMKDYAGELPQSSSELMKLPGIGPYTAAAIASFAYGESIPLIDGNVIRVVSRLIRLSEDSTKISSKTRITELLQTLIPGDQAGSFNQAAMDLGRSICLPKNPGCHACPVSGQCAAYVVGDMDVYPVKPIKRKIPSYDIVIGLIRKGDRVLIQKRPAKGLLGGLWEFPGGKIEQGESDKDALLREIKEETALDVNMGEKIGTIKHAYTHFKINLAAYYCDWLDGDPQTLAATENTWAKPENFQDYAFPKANLKILNLIDL